LATSGDLKRATTGDFQLAIDTSGQVITITLPAERCPFVAAQLTASRGGQRARLAHRRRATNGRYAVAEPHEGRHRLTAHCLWLLAMGVAPQPAAPRASRPTAETCRAWLVTAHPRNCAHGMTVRSRRPAGLTCQRGLSPCVARLTTAAGFMFTRHAKDFVEGQPRETERRQQAAFVGSVGKAVRC